MYQAFVSVVLALASVAGCVSAITVSALAAEPRHAAMAIDANSGQILHNDNGDAQRHPASLTKMMTLYLAFETIASGRMSMSTRIPISAQAADAPPSKLGLEPGDDIAASDAIKVLITKSANDIAIAVAEKIGGSQANFVRLMNTRADELGMTKTRFKNASGLPDPEQVTSARDMITLALRLQDDFPQYYPLFATRQATFGGRTLRNHNTLLNAYNGIDGIKTGYTRMSGFNLVSSVRRGGRHVVAAVFGGSSAASRNGEMRALLTRTLTRAATQRTRKSAPILIAKLKSEPKIAARPAGPKLAKAQVAKRDPTAESVSTPGSKPVVKPFAPPRYVANAEASQNERAPTLSSPSAPTTIADLAMAAASDTPAQNNIAASDEAVEPLAITHPATAPVEVFKVKRVVVMPRSARTVDPETTTDTPTDAAVASVGPIVNSSADQAQPADMLAQTFAANGAAGLTPAQAPQTIDDIANEPDIAIETAFANETVIGKSQAANYRVLEEASPIQTATLGAPTARAPTLDQIAMLGAADVEREQPVLQPVLQLGTERGHARSEGLAPSSLQAQAATLTPQQRVASPAVNRNSATLPAPRPTKPASGRIDVQIGAYDTVALAKEALANVKARAATVLARANAITIPVDKSGRTLYRARFSGFDASSAASACTELRRQAIDCFVLAAQ